jgi:uncharacterized protein YutE (UPF0331/DUF86 family)
MHRFRIAVAGLLVAATPLVTYQVASARTTGTSVQSEFCSAATGLEAEIESLDDIDLETVSISDVRTTYRQYVDLIKDLQKEVPKELKNALKRLRAFYNKIAEGKVDVTSERSVRRFLKDVEKAGKDVSRMFTYLEDECGITFESETTTPTTTAATTPTS